LLFLKNPNHLRAWVFQHLLSRVKITQKLLTKVANGLPKAKAKLQRNCPKGVGFFNAFGNVPASTGFLHKALKKPTPLKMVGI
jgi:hypothetical protein